MKRAMGMGGVLSVVALLWLSFSTQGCGGPSIRDVCVEACECASSAHCDADDETVEGCVSTAEAEYKWVHEHDCAAEYDDYAACYREEYQCSATAGFCEEEMEAYQYCLARI